MRRATTILLAFAVLAATAAAAGHRSVRPPDAVVRPASVAEPLAGRIAWAVGQAPKSTPGRAFWVGYSIDRLQGERSSIGWFDASGQGRALTIAEMLAGKTAPAAASSAASDGEVVRKAAKAALDDLEKKGLPEKKVIKELGFFLKYEPGRSPVLAEMRMSNLDLSLDFEGLTLFWLGKSAEGESLALVEKLYGSAAQRRPAGEPPGRGRVPRDSRPGHPVPLGHPGRQRSRRAAEERGLLDRPAERRRRPAPARSGGQVGPFGRGPRRGGLRRQPGRASRGRRRDHRPGPGRRENGRPETGRLLAGPDGLGEVREGPRGVRPEGR